jgi:glycosyltransferase involved in cell wall biosynthesis
MIPTVSAIIASFNYGQYLPLAIESCLDQTFEDLEVVVIDDGSIDNTPQVMEQFGGERRVRYVRTPNAGQPAAENRGISLAQGRFIAFLDADDIWLPHKIERQLEQFQRTPAAGVVYARRRLIDLQGRELEVRDRPCHRGFIAEQLFRDNFICFSSSLVRREVFDDVGFLNPEYRRNSDYDLWLRVATRWPFEFVDEPLVFYRTGHLNRTCYSEGQLRHALCIMERFVAAHPDALPPDLVKRCFAETYCSLGLVQRDRRFWAALGSYLRALHYGPLQYAPWRGLAALVVPEPTRRLLRSALRRPADWSALRPLADSTQETCS